MSDKWTELIPTNNKESITLQVRLKRDPSLNTTTSKDPDDDRFIFCLTECVSIKLFNDFLVIYKEDGSVVSFRNDIIDQFNFVGIG